ncbi:MAG: dTMP kinase [Solirubrobacteraceae bacterium]|nr:dTMP kinase [Solirubrobacteraceae bacterium]
MFITLEGLDGSGKTTLARGLASALGGAVLREPGGEPLAEQIRALVKSGEATPRAEALLFAAARAQLVDRELRPRLTNHETLILDRFVDSSLAYQGAGRGLDGVDVINAFATGGLTPDHTLYLRIDAATALQRIGDRGERDHFETLDFLQRVADGYDALAARHPERWITLDADQPPDDVLRQALAALA